MKKLLKLTVALLLSILICIPSILAVFCYTQPMEDVSYALFTYGADGEEWNENAGWTFYTEEQGEQKNLVSNGYGGYTGLSYPGQTFYYARTLSEALDDPTLKIGVANRTVCVFLDGEMIYTDFPELDNRIGYLSLPMLDYDRAEPVTISLPLDYQDKTLTIAQSCPAISEKENGDEAVWPCEVTLYCGYAYESSLIASSARTMLPAALLFSLVLLLLAGFIWNAFGGTFQPKLPVFALIALFQLCSVLARADFFFKYWEATPFDLAEMFFHFSASALLLFLTLCAPKKFRLIFLSVTTLQWLSVILSYAAQAGLFMEYGETYIHFMYLPRITGFLALLATLVSAFFLWIHGSHFFRTLAQSALLLIIGYGLFLVVSTPFLPDYTDSVCRRIIDEVFSLLPNFTLHLVWNLCLFSSLAAVLMDSVEHAVERKSEREILHIKNELAFESYENLRLQTEEIKMVRHDTMKHYSLLRTLAENSPEQIISYLDELIGEVQKIRPVINSKNQLLNILLNGALNKAAAKGITAEIERSDAPETLPLSDSQLCCLAANIMDNAIAAAAASSKPYLKLDLHCKKNHFIFSCENSMPDRPIHKKTPRQMHGYGLKIIRQIMEQFGNDMLFIEQSDKSFIITVIIPF